MEGTLRDYNLYTSEQATVLIKEMMQEVATIGGEFISIYHNDSFTTQQQPWINVYKNMLQSAV